MTHSLIGWKVFKYTKNVRNEKDIYSYCKTKIDKLSERIFLEDNQRDIFIYTSPSKTLEILITKETLEMRLFQWKTTETAFVVLEKCALKQLTFEVDDRLVTISDSRFEVVFYCSEEVQEFIAALRSTKTSNFVTEMKRLNKQGKCITEKIKSVKDFLERMQTL
ncbi:hypothetical protein GINT2_001338 [Glugoides intestinalis]